MAFEGEERRRDRMNYAQGHPVDSKAALAEWMGATVEEMDARHDRTHEELCEAFEVYSHSLAARDGRSHDASLAKLEEAAVLHVQRWLAHISRLHRPTR